MSKHTGNKTGSKKRNKVRRSLGDGSSGNSFPISFNPHKNRATDRKSGNSWTTFKNKSGEQETTTNSKMQEGGDTPLRDGDLHGPDVYEGGLGRRCRRQKLRTVGN